MKKTEDKYALVWSDEFEKDGRLDPKKWTYERGFVRNREDQWYQPENAFCEGGYLVIEGRREDIPNPEYDPDSKDWKKERSHAYFSSASVTTRGLHAWSYGRFEIKARIKTQKGLWPAIWTLGEGQEWPIGGEIDIMEFYQGNILANAAWASMNRWKPIWNTTRTPVSSFNDPDWSEKFHVWRMDWTKDYIKLYLDDQLLNNIPLSKTLNQRGDISNPFQETRQYLLLNLAIGGDNGGNPWETAFPSRFEIDYVRVYQMK